MSNTPNIENITRVQEEIRSEEMAEFDMSVWVDNDPEPGCGTAACIGGFCDGLALGHMPDLDESIPNEGETRDFLGIDYDTSQELFYGSWSGTRLSQITKDMAIRALEDLKTDNFISWKDYV